MANTHTHTHIHIVPRETQGGWRLRQRSDAILTHVGVAHPLIKFLGYELRDEAVGGMGSRQWQPHGVSRDTQGG